MEFDLVSDLHLEVGGIQQLMDTLKPNSDILVMAGDVTSIEFMKGSNAKHKLGRQFFKHISGLYRDVIWVFGNHEFYQGIIDFSRSNANDMLNSDGIENIHILENEVRTINDIAFFGATLWTDMNKENPVSIIRCKEEMNDYRMIKMIDQYLDWTFLTPEVTVKLHRESVDALQTFIKTPADNKVVITHHAPSYMSVPEEYRTSSLNAAYASELFVLFYGSDVKVAVHGHMHDPVDYLIDKTRVVSNPRGYYGYESSANEFQVKTVTV